MNESKKVECIACGEMVTHVSTSCEWCDECEEKWTEAKLEEEADMRANGMPVFTLH